MDSGRLVKIQVVLERELLEATDQAVDATHSSRSAFIREAIRSRLARHRLREMLEKDRAAYESVPETAEEQQEFDEWHAETGWLQE